MWKRFSEVAEMTKQSREEMEEQAKEQSEEELHYSVEDYLFFCYKVSRSGRESCGRDSGGGEKD